jgi:hypothetical protein
MKKLTELTVAQLAKRTEVQPKQTKLYDAKLRLILDTYIKHEGNARQSYLELGIYKKTFGRLLKIAKKKWGVELVNQKYWSRQPEKPNIDTQIDK